MKKAEVGGQAVIEGVMMKSKDLCAIAVREPSGKITVKTTPIKSFLSKYKLSKIPIIRGGFVMIESMIDGIKCLNYSSEIQMQDDEENEEDAFDKFIKKIFKDKASDAIIIISMIIAVCMSVGLFMLLPTVIGGFFSKIIQNDIMLNLIEGIIRVAILFLYIVLVSKNKEINRVFQYHGAEHKSIHCLENDEELTVENIRKYKRLHPRCGTNFLFIVMIISIIMFSFFGWPNPFVRILVRIVCVPIVAGISYEVIRLIGRYENGFTKIIAYPGMLLQYFTTSEPEDEQIEVAIASLKAVVDFDEIKKCN
jgi:uncharacterized protein YqhQ